MIIGAEANCMVFLNGCFKTSGACWKLGLAHSSSSKIVVLPLVSCFRAVSSWCLQSLFKKQVSNSLHVKQTTVKTILLMALGQKACGSVHFWQYVVMVPGLPGVLCPLLRISPPLPFCIIWPWASWSISFRAKAVHVPYITRPMDERAQHCSSLGQHPSLPPVCHLSATCLPPVCQSGQSCFSASASLSAFMLLAGMANKTRLT